MAWFPKCYSNPKPIFWDLLSRRILKILKKHLGIQFMNKKNYDKILFGGMTVIFCDVMTISCVSGGKLVGIDVKFPVLHKTCKYFFKIE